MTVSGCHDSDSGFGGKRSSVKTTDWMWGASHLQAHMKSHKTTNRVAAEGAGASNGASSSDDKTGTNRSRLTSQSSTMSERSALGPFGDPADGEAAQKGPPIVVDDDGEGETAREPLRRVIHQTMDDASYSNLAWAVSVFMMGVIILSTSCFILESEATEEGGVLYGGDAKEIFDVVEFVCVVIFTVEYLIRLATCARVIAFVMEAMNLIDLVAWLPFWITLSVQHASGNGGNSSFGFVRVVRLVRVFRVFKFGRYSIGIQMFVGAIVKSRQPLMVLVFMVGISTTIIASIMFLLEDSPGDDMLSAMAVDRATHSVCFGTIPRAFWWCLVTMTTVGYGDCYPITFAGKLLAMATMLLGVLILALPITVVGSNFHKMVEMFEEDIDDYGRADKDASGNIDEMELREFIRKKRRDGLIRKGVDINVHRLMEKYDPQGNGTLSLLEFTQLKNDVIDDSKGDPSEMLKQMLKMIRSQNERIEQLQLQVASLQKPQDVPRSVQKLSVQHAERQAAQDKKVLQRLSEGGATGEHDESAGADDDVHPVSSEEQDMEEVAADADLSHTGSPRTETGSPTRVDSPRS